MFTISTECVLTVNVYRINQHVNEYIMEDGMQTTKINLMTCLPGFARLLQLHCKFEPTLMLSWEFFYFYTLICGKKLVLELASA